MLLLLFSTVTLGSDARSSRRLSFRPPAMARRGRRIAGVYWTAEELALLEDDSPHDSPQAKESPKKRARKSTSTSSTPQDAPLPTGDCEVPAKSQSSSANPKRSAKSTEVAEAAADATAAKLVKRLTAATAAQARPTRGAAAVQPAGRRRVTPTFGQVLRRQLWRWRPKGWGFFLGLVISALFLSSNTGLVYQLSRAVSLVNDSASGVAAAVVDIASQTVNASAAALGAVASGTTLARTLWDGVDLANATLARRHGRVLGDGVQDIEVWLDNFSSIEVAPEVPQKYRGPLYALSPRRSFVEESGDWIDLTKGAFWTWRSRARQGPGGTAMAVELVIVRFEPIWSNPTWTTFNYPLTDSKPIARALSEHIAAMEPVAVEETQISDDVIDAAQYPSGKRSFFVGLFWLAACATAGAAGVRAQRWFDGRASKPEADLQAMPDLASIFLTRLPQEFASMPAITNVDESWLFADGHQEGAVSLSQQ